MQFSFLSIILLVLLQTCCFSFIFGISGLVAIKMLQKKEQKLRAEAENTLHLLLDAPDENTPSPLAVYSDQVATIMAARLVKQVQTTLVGISSGVAKNENTEIIAEVSGSSPWLGLIAGMLPKRLKNQLVKNPQFVGALSKFANQRGSDHGHEYTGRKHRE